MQVEVVDTVTEPARTDSGPLAEPIKIALSRPMIFDTPGARTAMRTPRNGQGSTRRRSKLELLFERRNIARTGNNAFDFMVRALDVARTPFRGRGFQLVDTNDTGLYKHSRSNPLTLLMLFADVKRLKRERDRSDSNSRTGRRLRRPLRYDALDGDGAERDVAVDADVPGWEVPEDAAAASGDRGPLAGEGEWPGEGDGGGARELSYSDREALAGELGGLQAGAQGGRRLLRPAPSVHLWTIRAASASTLDHFLHRSTSSS